MNTKKYDLGIIGAGPAGYTAAFHARKKGLSVVIFEKDEVGGVCLNRGCIPTKTILHSAEVFQNIKNAEKLGINAENVSIDFEKVIARKNSTVEKLRNGLKLALKNSGVIVIKADAKILDCNKIKANEEIFECEKIISAVGASSKELTNLKFDNEFILSSDDLLNLKKLPKSILIIGSGAIGIEWAQIFSAFNVDVTIVEMAEQLLPLADIEVSKRIERIFKSKKIKVCLSDSVEKIQDKEIHLKSGTTLSAEYILLAIGRTPNITNKIDGIKYLGDCCGEIQLAHFAIKQAISEISNIEFNKNLVPSVVYGTPEIAWIGKREQDLEPDSYQKSNLLISALGKSHCDDATEGFIKILSQNGKIVGTHIVSKEASALIQQITIAMQNNISVEELKKTCFAHPTYSEGIFECLLKL
ncbi:MAG: NAD(P)/FAD-dependent oxidoreductase [Candidatus Gastranaerophilales bacterium]